ncbi:hypothetical protein FACS1894151_01640 [Spirochaetia bacterium]|nr:hypothetical protein FACS1894151_01640 [Spirochaetia bacterium]
MNKETVWIVRKARLLPVGLVLALGMMVFAACEQSTTPPVIAPVTPAGLQVTAASSTSITINWTAVTDASSYKVYRSAANGGTYEAVDNPIDTSSIDTGLQADTTYWYKVTALNANGESGQSIAKSATTLSGGGTNPNVLTSVKSIQEKIDNDTTMTKNPVASNNGKLVSATYNTTTGNYTLVYKIGRINNLFSYYVTSGIPGGTGYGLSYTTTKETVKSTGFNATVSESVTVGVEAGVDAGVVAKSSLETTIGVSLSVTKTIEEAIGSGATYSYSFEKLNSDKLYAFALFSMLDFYQAFTYNKSTGTASPVMEGGKPVVYYDILNMFNYQICEYIPVNEIEFKTLEAWGSFTPALSSADNAKLDTAKENGGTVDSGSGTPGLQTSSSVYVNGSPIKISVHTGQMYTFELPVGLNINALRVAGYNYINITMDTQFRAQDRSDGRSMWLDIDKRRVWEKTNINVDWTSFERRTYTHSVPIGSFQDGSKFRFGFDQEDHFWNFTDEIWFFNEATVTFTAVK